MVHKPKISRKKKKKIKGKKTLVKKDVFEDEKNNLPISYPIKYLLFQLVSLLLLTFIVYSGTLDHSFHFDDAPNIRDNHFIQISSLSFDNLVTAGFKSVNAKRPVANISFALNYYFHGLDIRGYHFVNIIIHLLAGIMLYYFVKNTLCIQSLRDKFGEAGFVPFYTALIWMVHPLHTQSVTYIVQRMNSMAGMFFIMSMLFYVKGRLTPERIKKILFYIVSFITGILALGSKENSATLPFFILLYEWYFFQDLRLKTSKKQLFFIVIFGGILAILLYFFLDSSPLDRLFFPDYGSYPFTMAQRLLTQPRVVMHYISLLFYPTPDRLNLDYNFPLSYSLFSPVTTFIAIIIIIAILGLALFTARKYRLYSFCLLWFLGNLVIESSTIPLDIIFEHRTYLPSMMVILLIVLLLHQTVKKRRVLIVFLTAVAILFSYWTYERNKVWKNDLTLWADIQKKSPNEARANSNLGLAYIEKNRLDEAIPVLEKALYLYEQQSNQGKHEPKASIALNLKLLGLAYIRKNRPDEAIPVLEKALYLYEQQSNQGKYVERTDISLCLRLLGNAFRMRGECKKAIEHLDRALIESSNTANDVITYFLLGECYAQISRAQEAVFYFSKALQLSQNFYDVPWMPKVVDDIKLFLEKLRFLLEEEKRQLLLNDKND